MESRSATATEPASKGWSNLIYAGLGQHTWQPVISTLGDLLFARGEVKKSGAVSIQEGKGDAYMFVGNSFMKVSEKARKLGWVQKEKDLIGSMKASLPARG